MNEEMPNNALPVPVNQDTQPEESREDRVVRWTQKLLDLSLRNRLLNLRNTKHCIPLACANIALLEDMLAENEGLRLKSLEDFQGLMNQNAADTHPNRRRIPADSPTLTPVEDVLEEEVPFPSYFMEEQSECAIPTAEEIHDPDSLPTLTSAPELDPRLLQELKQKRLWTTLSTKETSRRLTAIYRQAKTDLEESGVNTLFLAVGFLQWKQSERDEKSYLAPILLIPVRLLRKTIAEGIRVTRLDEDTIINETLLELLRTQFRLTIPGVSPLPTDESGVDVPAVLESFRQAIKPFSSWRVLEHACIGLFSFGKFVMWTDMTARKDELKQNPLVKHLIEGGGIYDDGIEVFPPEEIARHLNLQKLFCPMNADSSQLAAILYSTMGKTFVLHGPPGTGKSQTITNIIAQNLALGRRVLFVSEKKAALDVVHKRLSKIGLRPFCLELHSNKSGKAAVLAQFAEALNVPETPPSGQWLRTVAELQTLQKNLTDYVQALHRKYPNGFSAYDCLNQLFDKENPRDELLDIPCVLQSQDDHAKSIRLVEELAQAYSALNPEAIPYLFGLNRAEWTPAYEKELTAAAELLRNDTLELTARAEAFCNTVGLPSPAENTAYEKCVNFAEKLPALPVIPEALLTTAFAENAQFIQTFGEVAKRLQDLEPKLASYNLDFLRTLDLGGVQTQLQQNAQAFFLSRFFKNHSLLKTLSALKKTGATKLTITELTDALPNFKAWLDDIRQYEEMLPKATQLLDTAWQGKQTDWNSLANAIGATRILLDDIRAIAPQDGAVLENCLAKLRKALPHAAEVSTDRSVLTRLAQDFITSYGKTQEEKNAFSVFSNAIPTIPSIPELTAHLKGLLEFSGDIRNTLHYLDIQDQAKNAGLAKFATALEKGELHCQECSEVFRVAYAAKMLDEVLGQDRVLARFSGLTHQQKIQNFRELDDQFTNLAKEVVYAKLAAALPQNRFGVCGKGTELGILKRECEKKARLKPVRQLLAEIPTLVPLLKPCFLMSPLSVAQYLPPDTSLFDLVVFDEASQIPVWDAIGVIARAKQLIVVGDPKQMPPTNFFQKGDTSEEEESPDAIEDMESILDECLAAGVHSSYLNWHYRSRHEALIAFSNHYYYDDRLFTFPAALLTDKLGVKFHFVENGVYDRRRTRTNRTEAEAMVRYIFDALEKSGEKKRSIGVVTFSEAQKNLLEDLLEEERTKHPDLEPYFSETQEEPLFVKNLENVQGDERDVILFSICYAPDADGKFAMNFGPLNRQGGERRLNVAITRAKEQVVVFSSIHASQIDLDRTSATGATHLKNFLDYAEKGLHIQNSADIQKKPNALAENLAAFLKEHGYATERCVGCSGYRIDLAVRHPDKPEQFLMAIECDGPAYASQRTTRDRDHLRHDVLCSLGWHVFQAWTMDWHFDRKRAETELLTALENSRNDQK